MVRDGDRRQSAFYHIAVQGELDVEWQEWFSGMKITVAQDKDGVVTTLKGLVADQAALRGILNKLWDLNLTVISVRRVT
ncbi:MAG: hypothetical protein ACP5J4_16565 [Anaerolineae bacterium]